MELQRQRLRLLQQNHVIDGTVYEAMNTLLDYLGTQAIRKDEGRLNMMSTHIAIALMRARRGEAFPSVDSRLAEEVRGHPAYAKALAIWQAGADILDTLPEGEKYYVLANFCNILEE